MYYKEDWEKIKEDFKAWWNKELDEALIQVFAPKKGSEVATWDIWSFIKNWRRPEVVIKNFEKYCQKTFFGGGAYPNLWINLGPCVIASYIGGESEFKAETVWYKEMPLEEIEKLDFNSENEWWIYTKEIIAEACKLGKEKFIVGLPDLGAVTDILASLRGSRNLVIDFYRNPDKIRRLSSRILDIWFKVYGELCGMMMEYGQEGISTWMGLWCHKQYYPIHADFAYMLSPSKFEELVLPYLKEYCLRLDYAMYHLDGIGQIAHVDLLLKLHELTGIQWVPGVGQPDTGDPKWLPLYKKVQECGKNLHLPGVPSNKVGFILKNLKQKGLIITTQCKSEEEARLLLKEH